jgi:diaminohydroxyphosphoribosylaminopyrimidine deaminase/5-amino-6-(5-phosphoribosylamino)uracil reductase
MSAQPDDDERWMAAALRFGRRNFGLTAPNPCVAALIVRDGVVVGRGVTAPGGRPHAEVVALAEAGEAARGATIYVTLEPCSHTGATPPCADAIVAAGLARVVAALEDPDARVAGRGLARLRLAGIAVTVGVGEAQARRDHRGHVLRVTAGRPMVTLKLARTADGYAAGDEHDARLAITGEAANGAVQAMRSLHDAIMIGLGTAREDDPLLTVRLPGVAQKPLRVVLDSRLELPLNSRLVATAREFPTVVIATPGAPVEREAALAARGVETARVEADAAGGGVDLGAALRRIAARGVTRAFSEGGPRVAARLIALGLADEVALFTAVKPLGRPGLPALDAAAYAALGDAARYRPLEPEIYGTDTLQRWERVEDFVSPSPGSSPAI